LNEKFQSITPSKTLGFILNSERRKVNLRNPFPWVLLNHFITFTKAHIARQPQSINLGEIHNFFFPRKVLCFKHLKNKRIFLMKHYTRIFAYRRFSLFMDQGHFGLAE